MARVTATRAVRPDVPRPIRRALGRLDRRLKGLAAVWGLGTAAAVSALGAAAGMAADFAWGFNAASARWGVWAAWVAVSLAPIAVAITRGRSRSRGLELAALLERVHPELGERLTGAVGLLLADGRGPAHGSPALIAALADDAAGRVDGLDPAFAAPAGGAVRRLALGLAALALVAAPGLVRPDPFGRLARRFLAPWAAIDRVGLYDVAVAPGDAVVAIGDDLKVTARVARRFGKTPVTGGAWLEWTEDATGRARRIAMGETTAEGGGGDTAGGPRAFSIVLPALPGSLTYRVASGSGESPRYRVKAVAPPALSSVAARVEPPAYTGLPASVARDPARVEAWEGSRVVLTLATAGPVRSAEVVWPRAVEGNPRPEGRRFSAEVAAGGRSATVALTADASGEYTVALRDPHGLASRPEPPRRVSVRADEPPTVAVRGVDGLDEAGADDTLRVGIAAGDDVAVASAELHYQVERVGTGSPGDEAGKVPAPLAGLGTRSARGEAALGLKALGLRPGDVVVYRARVADNRPAPRGPNVAWSGPRRLTVVAKADPLWARRDRVNREAVQAKLDALKKVAAENRHETELLRYAADAVQRGNGEWDRDRRQALGLREAEAKATAEGLENLAADLAEDPAFRPLAGPARQAAAVEAEAARATLDQARQADDPSKRLADLRLADSRLAAVSARLDDLQRGFNALAEREADRRRLQALADRQTQVAAEAEKAGADDDAHHPDRARLDKIAAEQNAVKNDLDALLRKSPELRAEVLAAQAEEADALARRAREVADRQRAEARGATELSKKSAAMKAIAEEQRAVEDDARRLALDVDAPLAENERARLNTEALRQAAESIERGDLDEGRRRLLAAEHDLRRAARDLEDVPVDPRSLARRLALRQGLLVNDLDQILGGSRGKSALPAEGRAEAEKALKALAGRQKAVAGLAQGLLDAHEKAGDVGGDGEAAGRPAFPRDAAEKAAAATALAADAVAAADNPREIDAKVKQARNALQRLSHEWPDAWRRGQPLQRAIEGIHREVDSASRDTERHLRETTRPNDKEPARTAADLAQRLGPVADRARKAAERLTKLATPPRLIPQRDRAARRALALAGAIDATRAGSGAENFDPARDRANRDAVSAAATGLRAAQERLEQKFVGNPTADDVADELAEEQRALAAGKPGDPGRADDQRRLATALRALQAPDAPLEHAEAVRLADRAARARDGDGGGDPGSVRLAAEAADALAGALTDRQTPRSRTESLARAERGLNDPDDPPDPVVEVNRQRAAAAALTRLGPDPGARTRADADAAEAAVRHAAELSERALHPDPPPADPARPTPAQQADARARAAIALDKLAAGLPGGKEKEKEKEEEEGRGKREDRDKEEGRGKREDKDKVGGEHLAPNDPELAIDPTHAGRANELARRERRVRERLQAVLGEKVGPQQRVRAEALKVGRDLADLRDRARALTDRANGPANEASALLGQHAPRAMDDAANQLAQGQPAPARDAQRRAAELAERGAQHAEDLAAALRADPAANANAAESKHRADPDGLAAAREAVSQAARQLGRARGADPDPAAMDAARQALQGAASRLQAAAEARGQGRPGPGPPGEAGPGVAQSSPAPSSGEPKGGRAGVADADSLAGLQEMIRTRTGRRWGELPGHLRTEILQMSQGRYRDDYARLIQLYFREIAAGAAKDSRP